jgi:serine protease Do
MRRNVSLFNVGFAVLCVGVCAAAPVHAQSRPAARGLTELSASLQELSERVSPSVVQIFVTGYAEPDADNPSMADPVLERSSGSGVIVDADGYIITNAHVVERATRLEVELALTASGGKPGASVLRRRGRTMGAQIVAIDPETDLAVIKIDARGLPALPFGDSDALRAGQLVLAFGSPLGLETSVTMGIVSAVARQLTPEDPMIYVQTDAPINPGNSGGALVDTDGRLVGISTLILSQSGGNEGIGFAAPSNIVKNVFTQIRQTGRVRRAEIGVHVQTVTALMAEALAIPDSAAVVLADVLPGSAAARAGLQPGDLVLSLDGKRMENGRQFRVNLYSRPINETVTLEIQRGDRRLSVRVPVSERQDQLGRLKELINQQAPVPSLGILGLALTPQIAQLLPDLRHNKGVVVVTISASTPVSQQGRLQPGDVIHAVNGRAVESIADLNTASGALKPSTPVVLHLERSGTFMYLAFRAER